MKINWIMVFALFGLFIITISTGYVSMNIPEYHYEMPNGVICDRDKITGAGLGGATHEFYNCDDGKIYINPERYKKVKR